MPNQNNNNTESADTVEINNVNTLVSWAKTVGSKAYISPRFKTISTTPVYYEEAKEVLPESYGSVPGGILYTGASLGPTGLHSWDILSNSPTLSASELIDSLPYPPSHEPGMYGSVDNYPKKRKTMSKELFYNRKLTSVSPVKGEAYKGLIGLEIECEGTKLFTTPFKYWTCHQDGSLREHKGHPPIEYVLRQPLDRDELTKALRYLEQKLEEAGSSVVQSSRTSVHVHLNVRDWTIRQIYCFILLYIVFEEILVEWSGPERAGNLFCLRAKDSEYYIQMLEKALKESTLSCWKEEYRYSACNVASVTKFGSLEFRSLRGTVDVSLITTWVDVLIHLMEKSKLYSDPTEIVEEFTNLGPLPFFTKIFDNMKIRMLFEPTPGLSGKLWDGLRLMRDVAYSCPWVRPKKREPGEPQEEEVAINHGMFVQRPEFANVQAGDVVHTPWGQRPVNSHPGGGQGYFVINAWGLPSNAYTFNPSSGVNLYMIHNTPSEYGGAWVLLSVRPD